MPTYHIKLAIQDVADGTLDSGVFLQASSFSSNSITASSAGGFTDALNNTIVVEGCKSSQVKLQLSSPPSSPLTVPLLYSGTATFGVDYAPLPHSIQFGVNETLKTLDVVPLLDNIAESTETIIFSIGGNACSSSATGSVTVFIKDSIVFGNVKDTFVCSQFPTLLSGPYNDTTTNGAMAIPLGRQMYLCQAITIGSYIDLLRIVMILILFMLPMETRLYR